MVILHSGSIVLLTGDIDQTPVYVKLSTDVSIEDPPNVPDTHDEYQWHRYESDMFYWRMKYILHKDTSVIHIPFGDLPELKVSSFDMIYMETPGVTSQVVILKPFDTYSDLIHVEGPYYRSSDGLLGYRKELVGMAICPLYNITDDSHSLTDIANNSDKDVATIVLLVDNGIGRYTMIPSLLQDTFDYRDPLTIPVDTYRYISLKLYVHAITFVFPSIDILDKHLNTVLLLYDYGYSIEIRWEDSIRPKDLYSLSLNESIVNRFPYLFVGNQYLVDYMNDIKADSNSSVGGTDMSDIFQLYHSSNIDFSWFFYPSGLHNYTRNSTYKWLRNSQSMSITPNPLLASFMLNYVKVVPGSEGSLVDTTGYSQLFRGINTGIRGRAYQYDINDTLRSILQTFNSEDVSNGIKIVLAGGFAITQGDYDIFILGNDIDLASKVMRYISHVEELDSVIIRGSVATIGSYQIILGENLNTIEDVLYSFDMSHTMIAHDGYKFYLTPEFITFTAAGMSLLYQPLVKSTRLKKCTDAGLIPVYQHVYIDIIPTVEEEYIESVPLDASTLQLLPGRFNMIYTPYDSDRIISSRIVSGSALENTTSSMYINRNYINVGFFPINSNREYYIEYDQDPDTDDVLIIQEINSIV